MYLTTPSPPRLLIAGMPLPPFLGVGVSAAKIVVIGQKPPLPALFLAPLLTFRSKTALLFSPYPRIGSKEPAAIQTMLGVIP